jgi:WXG100 family type VII secretion target
MSSDYTKVVFAAMESGQQDLVNSFNTLKSTVDTLDAQLKTHLSQWDGTARTAYLAAKHVWDTAITDMATVLQSLGQVVGTANENYATAERVNASMFSS